MIVNEHILINTLLVAFDLGGTFVFAISGAESDTRAWPLPQPDKVRRQRQASARFIRMNIRRCTGASSHHFGGSDDA